MAFVQREQSVGVEVRTVKPCVPQNYHLDISQFQYQWKRDISALKQDHEGY